MANADAEADASPGDVIAVELAYSPSAGVVEREPLQLPAGSRVADALRLSAMAQRHAAVQAALSAGAGPATGIWGKRCGPDQPLRDGDRVEVYRPLLIDPKDARRERQRQQQAATRQAGAPRSGEAQQPDSAAAAVGGRPTGSRGSRTR